MKNALEELEAMTGEEIYLLLIKSAWIVKKRAAGKGYSFANWIKSQDDARTAAAEAFITLYADAEKAAENGEPATAAAYRAAWKAAKRIDANERRNAADSIEAEAENGRENDRNQTEPAAPADEQPEVIAAALDAINRAARDEIDKSIIAMLAAGATRAQTADALQLSRQAIEKRLNKIRERMTA